ncbi:hypothetical protein [Methylobacterium nigriterrae]|uniref:hypothetical protein n=1 Tax=Methylobacterium nigriterrae TaxID=3127512 RepID=UPI00301413A2
MAEPRHFPTPWRIVELEECVKMVDAAGMSMAYFYLADDPERRTTMQRMSREEARKFAQAFAMLPDLREPLQEAMGLRLA